MKYFKLFSFLSLFFIYQNASAQSTFQKYFIDSVDNAVDVSNFLNAGFGFLPVPIIITEPAVGFGGGLTAIYFHGQKKQRENLDTLNRYAQSKDLPPITTGVAGAYTANGTWLGALFHQGSYKNDRFRYLGALAYLSPNLTFYGSGVIDDGEYSFNMQGLMTFHEFLFRPKKDLPLFTGLNYIFFNNNVTFIDNEPETEPLKEATNLGGMNVVLMWDNRDNTFTPTKGIMTATEFGLFDKSLGGDNDYTNFAHRTYFYLPIKKKKLFSGYRLQYQAKWGDNVPFFELPFVSLRGIPALRYQNHNALVLETEWRWQVFSRWSAVGFVGTGFTAPKIQEFDFTQSRVAGGFGFRYFIASDYGLHAGIDVARGPEIWAWYLTVGSNWFR
ncbi:BamA/TamA family outer membrane protein [Flammeovirga aprica]|uniref:BamA/TamA family outer membrane protein n=1 Tax=Flammeovirga aprica JL-4 TaxID=694437 RepID=A0A7X9P450_9BACT|nr:BamA/TamA family outer membrane protein [Flammeovirga aprica]NME68684.1 BamA/TamA family outer membrane protein [Flammeovirga aprica JL-4]